MAGERTYPLRFVRDLCDIPLDKLDDCLTDLQRAIMAVHTMRATLGDVASAVYLPEQIEWRDDGDRSATVNARANGEPIFSVSVGPDRPAPSSTE